MRLKYEGRSVSSRTVLLSKHTVTAENQNYYEVVLPLLYITYHDLIYDVTLWRHYYHTSHNSVSVVKTTFKVYGKRQNLTLSPPKTPEPIVTKFEWRDYVVNAYHPKNSGLNPPRSFCSPYRWNIHPSCSKFTTLFRSLTRPQASPLDRFLRLIGQMTRFCAKSAFLLL